MGRWVLPVEFFKAAFLEDAHDANE
jgi:hypothetical protein